MKTAFVFDGRSRATLQIVRSLGQKGVQVTIGNEYRVCGSSFSRYSKKLIIYPKPGTPQFGDFIFDFLKRIISMQLFP